MDFLDIKSDTVMIMTMTEAKKPSGEKKALTIDGVQGMQKYKKQKCRRMPNSRNHLTNIQ